jgi:hypothetical protein
MKLLGMMVVVAVAVGLGGLGGLLRAADEAKPPTVVKQKEDGGLTLLAIDASVHGRKAKLEKKGANPHNIGYWTDVKDTVTWEATLEKGGTFGVALEYSLAPNSKGAVIAIELGKAKPIEVPLEAGKDFLDFKTVDLGKVELPAGAMTVTVRPLKKPGVAVMDLRRIELKPGQ